MQTVNNGKAGSGFLNRTWSEWFSSFPVFVLLILTLIIGTGEMIHGQLLRLGEAMYGDPAAGIQYSFLRAEPTAPDCNRNPDIDAMVKQQMAGTGASGGSGGDFDSLFGPKNPEEIKQSLLAAKSDCEDKFKFFEKAKAYTDAHSSVRMYRTVEEAFFFVFHFGVDNRAMILVIMVFIAAITATLNVHHIGLRPPMTKTDFRVHDIAMAIGNGLLTLSCIKYIISLGHSGVAVEPKTMVINYLWLTCFAILTLISLYRMFRPLPPRKEGGNIGLALLAVPLYAWMAIVSGICFTFFMDYGVGQAIYLGQMVEYSQIFLNLSLFIWVGMLLTQTRVMDMFLNILRPWNFSPETLTWLLLIAASVPTAYTGASGIFVVAAGSIIYKEVWNSGARRQYALAVSAISGSLGVVVRPCLLIVVIVALNKEVTSDQLFGYGHYVFWLTAFVMLGVSLLLADTKFRIASPRVALPGMIRALGPVSPYVVITGLVLAFYWYVLKTQMNEFTAPVILPLILLAIVFYDKVRRDPSPVPSFSAPVSDSIAANIEQAEKPIAEFEKTSAEHEEVSPYLRTHDPRGKERRIGFEAAIRYATNETIGHIGALIILMALSVSVGGLIERAEIVHMLPTHMSMLGALTFMMLLLAFVGMCTDPFGAVILVSATIAPVAYQYGIHPIHFWMIVLMAFEFGYVTPPVALNHLLTRMSVGDEEVMAADAEAKRMYKSFYYRYERWILPVLILGSSLVVTTYAPYLLKLFDWYPK